MAVILVAAGILIFTSSDDGKRKLNERLSFNTKEKIPYGTFVAYSNLSRMFPSANISISGQEPGSWDSLSNYHDRQALFIISPLFFASDFEMKKLIRFAEGGNDVFVSAAVISEDAKNIINCSVSYLDLFSATAVDESSRDTLQVSLSSPVFQRTNNYEYPGLRLDCHFYRVDTTIATVLGSDRDGNPNFIHLKAGRGNLYFHLAPMAFTNYFLLRGKNIGYYEDVLSVISPQTKTVVWDEYFVNKRGVYESNSSRERSWISALFSYRSLKWALLTTLLALLVYALLEMRRKQRYIPIITPPRNDSMDFVKTIGRLYFDKGDHLNLCRKMAAYFLEHVRNRYKLATTSLNEDFIRALQFKSGIDEEEIRAIVVFIRELELAPGITDHQLTYFHKKLESFYGKS